MRAIILAAGVGKRLGESGQKQPKSLLRFRGKSLLQRHLESLRSYQIEQVAIAVGYQAELIQREIEALGAQTWVSTVYNPDYTQGSVVSLWTVREYLTAGDDLLLMDADVLSDYLIIERLVNTKIANCFLLDQNFEPGDEPVKLCVKENFLVEFRKQVPADLAYDLVGESVGFFRFDSKTAKRLAIMTEKYIERGNRAEAYEEVIRDLLLQTPEQFSYEDITGIPWIEIDFPEDLQRAKREILPKIREY